MSDLFMLPMMLVMIIFTILVLKFIPRENIVSEFSAQRWWVAPLFLIISLVGLPIYLIWQESKSSGIPFRIVAQSFWEYINAKNITERRLATLKLLINEKELEDNK